MNEGDVILTPLPQADGQLKNRPAVALRELPPFGDMLVCGVSTQLRQMAPGFDELIVKSDPNFRRWPAGRLSHLFGLSCGVAAQKHPGQHRRALARTT